MAQNQNINLLEELVVHPISAFNSKFIIQASIGLILILALIYGLAIATNSDKEKKLAKLEMTKQNLSKKIEAYDYESSTFAKRTENLKKLPSASIDILGFYRHFQDLAKFTPDGVWLSDIIISEPNNQITIMGSTVTAHGVSTLIHALAQSKSFSGKKFSEIKLQKDTVSKNIDFTISTATPTVKKNGEKVDRMSTLRRPKRKDSQTEEQLKNIL